MGLMLWSPKHSAALPPGHEGTALWDPCAICSLPGWWWVGGGCGEKAVTSWRHSRCLLRAIPLSKEAAESLTGKQVALTAAGGWVPEGTRVGCQSKPYTVYGPPGPRSCLALQEKGWEPSLPAAPLSGLGVWGIPAPSSLGVPLCLPSSLRAQRRVTLFLTRKERTKTDVPEGTIPVPGLEDGWEFGKGQGRGGQVLVMGKVWPKA